jgi:hypothetical protein
MMSKPLISGLRNTRAIPSTSFWQKRSGPNAVSLNLSTPTRNATLRALISAGYHPAEEVRYNQRSSAECVNGNLKDNCGAHHLRVRGAPKVFCHLMFGIVVVSVEQITRLIT